MLTISPTASAAIAEALSRPDIPDGAGLRLAAEEMTDRGVAINIALVESPATDDQIIETGVKGEVFVEAQTAELLDDQVLDADIDHGRVTFMLHPQAVNGGGTTTPEA